MPFALTADYLLELPRFLKRGIAIALDISLCILTVGIAFYLRFDRWIPLNGTSEWPATHWPLIGSIVIALPVFAGFGLYRAIFRYAGLEAMLNVLRAVGLYAFVYASIFLMIGVPGVPRTIGIIQPMLLFLAVAGSRMAARFWLGGLYRNLLKRNDLPRAMIYGAGSAGMQLASALAHGHEVRVIGYLDDDARLHGHRLNDLPVFNPQDLRRLTETLSISDVILAIPSARRSRRNEILQELRAARVAVRTLPSVMDLVRGKVTVSDLREPDIEDLLGREPVSPNYPLLHKIVAQKIVLVTGAGGSIGSELCRQIMNCKPSALLLVELSEYALYAIHQELQGKYSDSAIRLIPFIASVRDADRVQEILSIWKPDTIFHAAAYKHVPLVEHNPAEGIKNNTFGTLTMARAAAVHGVAHFVLISTDKAVRPTNVMGASKRLAEMILQALAAVTEGTNYSMVRFGNVLGSSGSVVPKFRQQIRDGGPITLTHPEITRYFMTIPEAAQLVIQAGAMATGGEVFVLDMGGSVKIMDLAVRMVELSGLTVKNKSNPDGDIEIEIVGLRPGEKLYEELLIGDNPRPTFHPRILKAREDFLPWSLLQERLAELQRALDARELDLVRGLLGRLISGYQPSEQIVDWIYMEQDASTSVSDIVKMGARRPS
jgi:FlaA1/EpsC-like NDP-sugar epimerase